MVDLHHIKTFVLITQLGSLAAAARILGISAAAVSKQITRLEKELGVQLLVRSTRKLELTEIGVSYCLQCMHILEEVETASDLISQTKIIPHGALKVVSGRHFANFYIVPHVKEFLLKYPKIELNLELAERIPNLDTEAIDIIIGMSISAHEDAIQKRIGTTSYSLCAAPDYLKEFGIPEKPEDLKKHRYIAHSMRKPDNELVFHNKEVVTLTPYLRVNDTETMLNFALNGLGIVKLHHYVVEKYLKQGTLHALLTSHNNSEVPIYVAYLQRRFISLKVRCFIDFITEKISPSI